VLKNQLEPGVSEMTTTLEEMNKALGLEAFDTLFNKRDILEDAVYRNDRQYPRLLSLRRKFNARDSKQSTEVI
jgi:hypothetical protein